MGAFGVLEKYYTLTWIVVPGYICEEQLSSTLKMCILYHFMYSIPLRERERRDKE